MIKSFLFVSLFLVFLYIIPFFFNILILIFYKFRDKIFDYYLYLIIKHILKVKNIKLNNNELISKGFIISNHQSVYDIFHDLYFTKSIPIAHYLIAFHIPFAIFMIILCNRIFFFNKTGGKIDKTKLFEKIKKKLNQSKKEYSRCLLYPEGIIKIYKKKIESVDELKKNIKYGLLKEIYKDNQYPVQLYITSYKEKVLNHFSFDINFNQNTYTKISKPIYPKNYKTFEDFSNAIVKKWYKYYLDTNI